MNPDIPPFAGFLFIFLLMFGLWLDFIFVTQFRGKEHQMLSLNVPWEWQDFLMVAVFYWVLQEGLGYFTYGIQKWLGISKLGKLHGLWFWNFLVMIISVSFLLRLLKRRYGVGFSALGFSSLKWDHLFKGFLYYAGAVPVLLVAAVLTRWIAGHLHIPLKPQIPMLLLKQETSPFFLVFACIFVVVIAPLCEEMVFRGFIYPLFRKRLGLKWAMAASSALFAALHFSFLAFLPIMVIGMLLAYLYESTGSLMSSICFHVINNAVAVCIVLLFLK